MNNEIWFVLDGKKIVLDSDPFEKHNGYFYLPGGAIGHANNMAELLAGKIEVKREFDCPKAKHVPAFTVRMQNFDVEFDNGIPVRFWYNLQKTCKSEHLHQLQLAAQKICDRCKFGTTIKHDPSKRTPMFPADHEYFGVTVKEFVVANKDESSVYNAIVVDNYQTWINSR